MPRYYTGKKPCPGCGLSGEERSRGGADELCWDCKKLLKLGKGVKKDSQENEYTQVKLARYTTERFHLTEHLEGFGESKHSLVNENLPYISKSFNKDEQIDGTSQKVINALRGFFEALDQGEKSKYTHTLAMDESGWHSEIFSIPTKLLNPFLEFWIQICSHSKLVQKEAFENGKNLLAGLANGTLTMKDFEEKSKRH